MNLVNIKAKFKNKQDLTFLGLGILMSILVFVYLFYAIDFLTIEIQDVLNAGKSAAGSTIKFDIDKIKALEIQKTQQ